MPNVPKRARTPHASRPVGAPPHLWGAPTDASPAVAGGNVRHGYPLVEHQGDPSRESFAWAFLDAAADAVFVHDRSGLILDCNLAAWRLGAGAAGGPGSLRELISPEDWEEVAAGWSALSSERPFEREADMTVLEAGLAHVSLRSALVAVGGERLVVTTCRDVTAYRDLQEALRIANVAAEAALTARASFIANVSHELRTPMNAIIGLSHLTLREAGVPDRAREYVEKLNDAASSLLGLVEDVLDLAKMDAGRMTTERVPFSLDELFETLESLLAERAHAKGVGFSVEIEADVPRLLLGDPLRLRQVLINLLGNAVKFTTSGWVRLVCRHAPSSEEPAHLEFEVTDTGVGIDPELHDVIFEPFAQADSSTSRRFGGTGLGLNISHRLVGLMGGTLDFESAVGCGTTFRFALRFGQMNHELDLQRRAAGAAPIRLDGLRALLVDDHPLNQIVGAELLRAAGAQVDLANDGSEALSRLARPDHGYHLVFMDVQMPVLDGVEATRRIRAFPHLADLPVIAMTAQVFGEDRRRSLAAGMSDHITKPIEPIVLLSTAERWFRAPTGADGARRPDQTVE